MTSAEPVDMTAMRMRKRMAYSPVVPSNFWATKGAARPAGHLIIIVWTVSVSDGLLTLHHVLLSQHGSPLGRGESKVGEAHRGGKANLSICGGVLDATTWHELCVGHMGCVAVCACMCYCDELVECG